MRFAMRGEDLVVWHEDGLMERGEWERGLFEGLFEGMGIGLALEARCS